MIVWHLFAYHCNPQYYLPQRNSSKRASTRPVISLVHKIPWIRIRLLVTFDQSEVYPNKLGQSWRHEAIVSRENGGPFMRTKKVCCFQSRIESGQYYYSFFGVKRRCRRFCGQILRLVKCTHYFLVFTYFSLSCVYFLLVLVLLKFHHAKLHGCKQRRYFVNSLWIWGVTSVPEPLLL